MEDKLKASDYQYSLPEDYELNEETRKKLDALVDKAGLSNELAQEFLSLHVEIMEEFYITLQESLG